MANVWACAPPLVRERLSRLRKNPGFDFALKGRGFSRAVSVAKSLAALAADALPSYQSDFFRSLLVKKIQRVAGVVHVVDALSDRNQAEQCARTRRTAAAIK